jgi:uncharacterized protein YceH (UPF0502 family)
MDILLNGIEVRVLGSLLEKELATPEYYPLSLNALVNACNQKTNRQPVLSLDAETVAEALRTLKEQRLVYQSDAGRVAKYWQGFAKQHDLGEGESALLALLLLRGPQTAGELRSRADNLNPFDSLEQVGQTLDSLAATGLVTLLPRRPGQKEQRYTHLLAGEPEPESAGPEPVVVVRRADNERLAELEQTVTALREELEQLRDEFLAFRRSLEG